MHKVVRMLGNEFNISQWFGLSGFEIFADDYIYGIEKYNIWCLTYPDLELVYTNNPELKVVDAKAEIEELFGKMEWE